MISGMKKLTLAATKSDMERITERLVWLSVAEICDADDLLEKYACDGVTHRDVSALLLEGERQAQLLSDAIEVLSPYGSAEKGEKKKKNEKEKNDSGGALDYDRAVENAGRVKEILSRKRENDAEIRRLESEIAALSPWRELNTPLSFTGTHRTVFLLGTLPASANLVRIAEEIKTLDGAVIGEASSDGNVRYCYAICLTERRDALLSLLVGYGFSKVAFRDGKNTPLCEISARGERIKAEEEKNEEAEKELRELAKERRELEKAYDRAQEKIAALRVQNRLVSTEQTCILRAWVPDYAVKMLEKKLSDYDCCFEVCDPAEGEDVPVLLQNNRFASPFESIIGSYGYPRYGSFDPTFIVAIFYSLIFGMIMQDVGYGLLLTLGCPLLIRKMNPKKSTKQLLQAFTLCGISTVVFGVLFGGYFGDLPHQLAVNFFGADADALNHLALLFNPVENNTAFLILTLAVGGIHMVVGMLIRAYMLAKRGDLFAAIFDVGSWIVLFAGLLLLLFSPSVGKIVALCGAAMLVLTQGRHSKNIFGKIFGGIYSLYNIIGYMSDLLSYSRIFALGLSGAIIGQVMNILGTLSGGGFFGFIILIVIFLVGHGLNLALSMISCYVHTARLQYIEFFGKFYEEGGRPFAPATVNTKYTNNVREE